MKWIVCGFCGKRRSDAQIAFKTFGVCRECMDKLPYTDGSGCFPARYPLDYVIAPFYYKDIIRQTLHEYKFHDKTAYADIFAEFISRRINGLASDFDFAVSVPLSKRRLLERGYNQSELIAARVCANTGINYKNILVRIRETKRQTELDTLQRAENVKDAFECVESVSGMRILLFDDIYTHGFTACAAANALINKGCKSVVCAAAAIVK